ncbi:MAG: hypothetical protein WCA79_13110 [Anaerolineales bacterium]
MKEIRFVDFPDALFRCLLQPELDLVRFVFAAAKQERERTHDKWKSIHDFQLIIAPMQAQDVHHCERDALR